MRCIFRNHIWDRWHSSIKDLNFQWRRCLRSSCGELDERSVSKEIYLADFK